MPEVRRQVRKKDKIVRQIVLAGGLGAVGLGSLFAVTSKATIAMIGVSLVILVAIAIVHIRAYIRATQSRSDPAIGSDGRTALILTTCLCIYSITMFTPELDLMRPVLIPGVMIFIGAAYLVNRSAR